jgi:rhodanese-related sulfurtransferase
MKRIREVEIMVQLKRLFSPVPSLAPDKAREFIAAHPEGSYTLLDVRQPEEYKKEHIPGAKLIPLPSLNDAISELDPEKPVIAY